MMPAWNQSPLTSDIGGWTNYTVRAFFNPAGFNPAFTPALPQFVFFATFGAASGGTGIGNMWVGPAAAGAPSSSNLNAQPLTRVTAGRANSWTAPAGTSNWTDIIQFLWDKRTWLYVGWYVTTTNMRFIGGITPQSTYWFRAGVDESGSPLVDASQYAQQGSGGNAMALISQVGLQDGR